MQGWCRATYLPDSGVCDVELAIRSLCHELSLEKGTCVDKKAAGAAQWANEADMYFL